MSLSKFPGFCFISDITLLLPLSVSQPKCERSERILSIQGEAAFKMVPSLIHMVTLDSTLNFFYYKYQSVYSLSVISKDHMLTESI